MTHMSKNIIRYSIVLLSLFTGIYIQSSNAFATTETVSTSSNQSTGNTENSDNDSGKDTGGGGIIIDPAHGGNNGGGASTNYPNNATATSSATGLGTGSSTANTQQAALTPVKGPETDVGNTDTNDSYTLRTQDANITESESPQVGDATLTLGQEKEIAKQYGMKTVSNDTAKKLGMTPISVENEEQLNYVLSGKLEGTQPYQATAFAKTTKSNSKSKIVRKGLYTNGVEVIYGNVRFTRKGHKIKKIKNVWTDTAGLSYPVQWEQRSAWVHINKGRRSGIVTFKGERIFSIIIPGRTITLVRPTTFKMRFKA